jgi:hypothetical protein
MRFLPQHVTTMKHDIYVWDTQYLSETSRAIYSFQAYHTLLLGTRLHWSDQILQVHYATTTSPMQIHHQSHLPAYWQLLLKDYTAIQLLQGTTKIAANGYILRE